MVITQHRLCVKRDHADITQTHLLMTFLPEAAKPRAERTAAEQATVTSWHQKVAWFLALRHVGRQPSFK